MLVSARKFRDLQVGGEEHTPLETLDHASRPLSAPEMQPDDEASDRSLDHSSGDRA